MPVFRILKGRSAKGGLTFDAAQYALLHAEVIIITYRDYLCNIIIFAWQYILKIFILVDIDASPPLADRSWCLINF